MSSSESTSARNRYLGVLQRFVTELSESGRLKEEWVKNALLNVPRHLFVDAYCDSVGSEPIVVDRYDPTEDQLKAIYDIGQALGVVFDLPYHSTVSAPIVVTSMLEALSVTRGQRVLEIGAGSGWNAGLLAHGVGDGRLVHSIDFQPNLVARAGIHLRDADIHGVNLRVGDGALGWPEVAPFDRIIAAVGVPDLPGAWFEQLGDAGILLVPFETGGLGNPVLRLSKNGSVVRGKIVDIFNFMTMQGEVETKAEAKYGRGDELRARLAKETPYMVEMPESVNVPGKMKDDALFYMYLKSGRLRPWGFSYTDVNGVDQWESGVIDLDTNALLIGLTEDSGVLKCYGDRSSADWLLTGLKEWADLGQPLMTQYDVEVERVGARISDRRSWVVTRPSVTLRFSLASE